MIQLANLILRGLTLVSKFVLIFFLAKYLNPDEVGLYGLLAASISYALYVVGLEFYTFSTREIIGRGPGDWLGMIRDQAAFYLILYAVLLPFMLIVFAKGWLPWAYAGWFFVLLILEHIAQELNRILISMSEQLLASAVLFLRSGAWCLIAILTMWFLPSARNLDFALGTWICGATLACCVAVYRLLKLDKLSLKNTIDWGWVFKGIKIAIPLLLASLAVRGMFTFDRYLVESVASLEVLGAYVLFIGMANAILSFLDAGVIVFMYPKLVMAAKRGEDAVFRRSMKVFFLNVLAVTAVLVLACWLISGPLIEWLKKPVYTDNLFVLGWLLFAISIYAMSMVPHLGLYAHSNDRPILHSQVAGLVVFLLVVFMAGKEHGVIVVPWGLCAGFFVVLVWKLIAYVLMRSRQQSVNLN